jgi:rod shape-determining protein MreC
VLTSGGDLIFPKGLLIGTVARIEKGPEFLEIAVKPAAALNRLEEVLVILKKEEREPVSPAVPLRAADILAERLPSVPDKPATPIGASADKPPAANQAGMRGVTGTGPLNTRTAQPEAQGKLPGAQNVMPPSASGAVRSPGADARTVKPATISPPASTPARKPPDSTTSKPASQNSSEPTPSTNTPQ